MTQAATKFDTVTLDLSDVKSSLVSVRKQEAGVDRALLRYRRTPLGDGDGLSEPIHWDAEFWGGSVLATGTADVELPG